MQSEASVSPKPTRLAITDDVVASPLAPEDDPNHKDAFEFPCDICYYFGDKVSKRVKWKYGVIVCRPCFLSMKEIQVE